MKWRAHVIRLLSMRGGARHENQTSSGRGGFPANDLFDAAGRAESCSPGGTAQKAFEISISDSHTVGTGPGLGIHGATLLRLTKPVRGKKVVQQLGENKITPDTPVCQEH